MFIFNAVHRWWNAMWDINQEMLTKMTSSDSFSAEADDIAWRANLVMHAAVVPPLARYLQRKLMT